MISGNTNSGVAVASGATANVVEGDFIGTDGTGTVAIPNHTGVLVGAAPSTTVGGTAAGSGDVISGNINVGVWLTSGASKEVLAGDDIGTDLTGWKAVPNGTGVRVNASSTFNTIGGTSTAARDVISGNAGAGVSISDPGTNNNLVAGDLIGTIVSGTAALGNGTDGVLIANSAHGNTVGGTSAAAHDIISGNSQYGVAVTNGVTATTIAGNFIGTDLTGLLRIPNQAGVIIGGGSTFNTVGGTVAGSLNVISANVQKAVTLSDAGTNDNLVEGNFLGTDASGLHALGNGGAGVAIVSGAQYNTVGGTTAAARNILAASAGNGVIMGGTGVNNTSTSHNVVEGNFIGTDRTGTAALGEGIAGVNIEPGANTTPSAGRRPPHAISSRPAPSACTSATSAPAGNLVEGDYIGTDVTGTRALGNVSGGVFLIDGAADNTIGGTTRGSATSSRATSATACSSTARARRATWSKATTSAPTSPAPLALANGDATNGADGVAMTDGASDNTVGGTTAGAGNVIAGTAAPAWSIAGPGSTGNVVAGNFIGTDATGTARPRQRRRRRRSSSARRADNTIGGTTAGARNVISGNAGSGVTIDGRGHDGQRGRGQLHRHRRHRHRRPGQRHRSAWTSWAGRRATPSAGRPPPPATSSRATAQRRGRSPTRAPTHNVVEGNYIGTDADRHRRPGQRLDGVVIDDGASNNTIGGTTAAARNVISGNTGRRGASTARARRATSSQGNYIGTDATGTDALGNGNCGVWISGGAQTTPSAGRPPPPATSSRATAPTACTS